MDRFRRAASYLILPIYVGGVAWLLVSAMHWSSAWGDAGEPLALVTVLGLAVIVCVALEWIMPFRPEWNQLGRQEWNDLGHLFFQVLPSDPIAHALALLLLPGVVAGLSLDTAGPYWPVAWPMAVQVALVLVIQEIAGYAFHRLSHSVPWLWRFHRFHHTSERLTATKQFRQSFVEGVLDAGILLFVVGVAGVPLETMYWTIGIAIPLGLMQHSNVDVRTPRFVNRLLVTPQMHRIHHARSLREGNSNFGIGLSIFDVALGTFVDSDRHELGPLGLPRNSLPQSFWGQVSAPFRWGTLDGIEVPAHDGE